MSDFERQVYTDMSATDRILIWMVKALELKEFGELMQELGDMPALKQALTIIRKGDLNA